MVQRARQMAGVGRSSAPISEQLHWERMMAWMQRTQDEVNEQVMREVAQSQAGQYFNHMVPSHKSSFGVPANPSMTYFNPTLRPVMPKVDQSQMHGAIPLLNPPMPSHAAPSPVIPLHPSVAAATPTGWFPITVTYQNTQPVPKGVPLTPPPGHGIPFPVPKPGNGIPSSVPEPGTGIPSSPAPMPNAVPNQAGLNTVSGATPPTPPEPKPPAAPAVSAVPKLGVPAARVPAPVPRTPGVQSAGMQASYPSPGVPVPISCPKGALLMLLFD
jgi:hypothetical protein